MMQNSAHIRLSLDGKNIWKDYSQSLAFLTKDTIGKPAFYAFSFLEHMGTQFLSKGDNYLLTKKGNGDLYLLCYNFCWFRQNGLMSDEAFKIFLNGSKI